MDAKEEQISYKVKTINFLNRKVPIMMQNRNGPCPLLALANVLLLRNRITLPTNTTSISQERLVSLVAGHLLDCNNEQRLARLDSGTRANLWQNMGDAIAQLPKLATGLDVNVRFHDIRGFEFTQDTAIFDLLDVRLLHGWLVDPQDQETAECVAQHSYNELVSLLVDCLGEDATPPLQTPKRSHRPEEGLSRGRDSPGEGSASEGAVQTAEGGVPTGNESGMGAAKESEMRPSGTSGIERATGAAQNTDSRPVDANELSNALQDVHMDDEESRELQEALALSLIDTGREPTANNGPPPPPHPSLALPVEDSMPPQGHSPAANSPIPFADPTGSKTPAKQPVSSADNSSTPQPAIQPATPPLEEGAGVGELGSGGANFAHLNPLRVGDVDAGAGSVGQAASGRPAMASSSAEEEGQSSSDAAASGAGPLPVEAQPEASSTGSHGGAEGGRHQSQPEKAKQYDARALAKGKMPAYMVPSTADVDERKQSMSPEDEEGADAAAMEDIQSYRQSQKRAREMQKASLIQAYFDRTSSQLTQHGLHCLHQGMRPNELGILFRNNHFNTLFAHNGAIWMLATDQGYLFEEVVWEKLSDVQGNNEFCMADFAPYTKRPLDANVHTAVQLTQEAFASGRREPGAAGPDADLALALQMQEEENERQARFLEQQRQLAEQERLQREPQAAPRGGRAAQAHPDGRQGGGVSASGPQPGSRAPRRGEAKAKKSSVCSIM